MLGSYFKTPTNHDPKAANTYCNELSKPTANEPLLSKAVRMPTCIGGLINAVASLVMNPVMVINKINKVTSLRKNILNIVMAITIPPNMIPIITKKYGLILRLL